MQQTEGGPVESLGNNVACSKISEVVLNLDIILPPAIGEPPRHGVSSWLRELRL